MSGTPAPFPIDKVAELAARGYMFNPGVLLGRGFHLYQVSRVALREPVLDIGCGDGVFATLLLELLASRDGTVAPMDVGVDVDAESLKRAARTGSYRNLARASGERLPFRDGTFGTVISNCVFEHIPNVRSAVSESARVLARGGVFVLTVPSDRYGSSVPGYRLLNRVSPRYASRLAAWYNSVGGQIHTLPKNAWESILRDAGLAPRTLVSFRSPAANRRMILLHYLFTYGRGETLLYLLSRAADFLGCRERFDKVLRSVWRACFRKAFLEVEKDRAEGDGAELLVVASKGG